MEKRSYKLYQNPLSKFSFVMASMVFVIEVVLLTLDYVGVPLNATIGVLTYTLIPGALLVYILLIPVGVYREWRRRHRQLGEEPPAFPRFDFNVRSQRVQLYVVIMALSILGMLILAVGFRAYEFTESIEFCGELCHKVMTPEASTYKESPHARVTCVQCHVGEGATWYMKSKLSGLYQVYATLFNKYPRPIETPISNLRPSSDTCERCHWPTKFYGARQVMKTHFQEDEKNTPRQFLMLLNIGGGLSSTGIHWHVGQDEVYYISRDKSRQDIPWIRVKHKDGRENIFTDTKNPLTQEEVLKAKPRKMDCLDCHNRPTHIFKSPREAMDEAMLAGDIDLKLPYIKKEGVEFLSKEYANNDEALASIRNGIFSFYREKYPEFAMANDTKIDKAVQAIQRIWRRNNFLHMKSKWTIYPNNLGHFIWPGCSRCHDENHKDETGQPIKKECNTCHLFLNEKLSGFLSKEIDIGRPFEHPADVGGADKEERCNTCHSNY